MRIKIAVACLAALCVSDRGFSQQKLEDLRGLGAEIREKAQAAQKLHIQKVKEAGEISEELAFYQKLANSYGLKLKKNVHAHCSSCLMLDVFRDNNMIGSLRVSENPNDSPDEFMSKLQQLLKQNKYERPKLTVMFPGRVRTVVQSSHMELDEDKGFLVLKDGRRLEFLNGEYKEVWIRPGSEGISLVVRTVGYDRWVETTVITNGSEIRTDNRRP